MSATAQLIKKRAKKKLELKGENDLFVLSRKELYELTGSIEEGWAHDFHSAMKKWLKKLRRVNEALDCLWCPVCDIPLPGDLNVYKCPECGTKEDKLLRVFVEKKK